MRKCFSSLTAFKRGASSFPSIRSLSSMSSSTASSSISSSSALQSSPAPSDPSVLASATGTAPASRSGAPKVQPLSVNLDFSDLSKSHIHAYNSSSVDVNEVELRGSVFVLPQITLLWKPRTLEDIDVASLKILELANPRIEYLIIGLDDPKGGLHPEVRKYLLQRSCTVEIMETTAAIGTFTFLNEDYRSVAVALLRERAFEQTSLQPNGGSTQAALP